MRARGDAVLDYRNALMLVLHEDHRQTEAHLPEEQLCAVLLPQELQLVHLHAETMVPEACAVASQGRRSVGYGHRNRSKIVLSNLEKQQQKATGHSDMTRYAFRAPPLD